jgi:DNA-binding MarR family transcriptional regulator
MALTQRAASTAPPSASPTAWEAEAIRFLRRTGSLGHEISVNMVARVGDMDLVGNLQVLVASELFLHGHRRPVEIQTATGMTSGGVTKLLDRMEAVGLIERAHGVVPGDRRAIVVRLTDDGVRYARLLVAGLLDSLDATRVIVRDLADEADALAASVRGLEAGRTDTAG